MNAKMTSYCVGAPAICPHCNAFENEHDDKHLARECYPKRLAKLQATVDRVRAALFEE